MPLIGSLISASITYLFAAFAAPSCTSTHPPDSRARRHTHTHTRAYTVKHKYIRTHAHTGRHTHAHTHGQTPWTVLGYTRREGLPRAKGRAAARGDTSCEGGRS
eukprot:GHVU01195933.1.p2 GENE.GHVU01195933.1~~GHVU01195933.1.p2  ORF type:complete len:104 (-),score=6.82 GHVU01195933.1:781-1092(-)